MPYGVKLAFKQPRSSWPCHRRGRRTSINGGPASDRKVDLNPMTEIYVESEVVETLPQAEEQPIASRMVVSNIVHHNNSISDDENDHTCVEHVAQNDSHRLQRDCCFTTAGSANVSVHPHAMGLARVFFGNCVVKVRMGHDLDQMVAHSQIGPVQLHNIKPSGSTLHVQPRICAAGVINHELPVFVFLRWISSMNTKL